MRRYPNLRAEMARAGVSVADIAERVGVGKSTVYSWMNGSSDFTVSDAFNVAGMFDCSVDYLFAREGGEPGGRDRERDAGRAEARSQHDDDEPLA